MYHLNQQTTRASTEVVSGMTLINGFESYVLINTGDTHSFITPRFMNRLQIPVNRLNEGFDNLYSIKGRDNSR